MVFPDDKRTLINHQKSTNSLWTMVNSVADACMLESSYESHIHDAQILTESHPCSTPLLDIPDVDEFVNESRKPAGFFFKSQIIQRHRIDLNDPFLNSVLKQLKYFFFNDIDTNLGLTQVIVDLASCRLTQLEGWLLGDSVSDQIETTLDPEQHLHTLNDDGTLKASSPAPELKILGYTHTSPLFDTLESLVYQVEQYRQVMDFDEHLKELRQTLANNADVELDTKATDALQKTPNYEGSTPIKVHRSFQATSGSARSGSEGFLESASRSSSPRGRQLGSLPTPRLVGRLNHLHISPSRSPSQSTSRTYSASPLRNSSITTTAIKTTDIPKGPTSALLVRVNLLTPSLPLEHCLPLADGSETGSIRSMPIDSEAKIDETKEVALGHLLTNVIVLQEFILELTAVVEVRTSIFDEVRFVE